MLYCATTWGCFVAVVILLSVISKSSGIGSNVNITLISGPDESAGIVKIQGRDGKWLPICHSSSAFYRKTFAIVVCDRLGFSATRALSVSDSEYNGTHDPSPHLSILSCTIRACTISLIPSVLPCPTKQMAAVDCGQHRTQHEYEIRLENGYDEYWGRLEISIYGEWGTVCDDGFGTKEADVVCRQLGFPMGGEVHPGIHGSSNRFQRIWLDEVRCIGNESRLIDCQHAPIGRHDCYHVEDINVRCYEPDDYSVRLVGGSNNTAGRLEVKLHGVWGTVCRDNFNHNAADVVCRQLGTSATMGIEVPPGKYGEGRGPIFIDDIQCSSYANSIAECSFANKGAIDCDHSEDVGVECFGDSHFEIRLRGGPNDQSGRLEVNIRLIWGYVCADSFDALGARVACRQLGKPITNARVVNSRRFVNYGSRTVGLDHVNYVGSESRLDECDHSPAALAHCNSGHDVAIECREDTNGFPDYSVRLVGGTDDQSGRLEVSLDGVWGTVCDDDFDDDAAAVVCRQLGYSDIHAERITDNRYGVGEGDIFLDDVICYGQEDTLEGCSHSEIGVSDCEHSEDVAVKCHIKRNKAVIAGCILGGLAVLIVICLLYYVVKKRMNQRRPSGNKAVIAGCILGGLAVLIVICLLYYVVKKRMNQRRPSERRRRNNRDPLAGQVNYTVNLQHNNGNGVLQTEFERSGRTIVPPSVAGVYTPPPAYWDLFPNGNEVSAGLNPQSTSSNTNSRRLPTAVEEPGPIPHHIPCAPIEGPENHIATPLCSPPPYTETDNSRNTRYDELPSSRISEEIATSGERNAAYECTEIDQAGLTHPKNQLSGDHTQQHDVECGQQPTNTSEQSTFDPGHQVIDTHPSETSPKTETVV